MPPSLNHFHSAWQATEESKRTLNEFYARLMAEESRLNSASGHDETSDIALIAKRSNLQKDKVNFSKSRRRGNCFRCGSSSHWRRDCKEARNTNERERKSEALCCDALFSASEKYAWYLDSGATEHMSGRCEWFRDYFDLSVPHPVRIGNGDTIEAVGQGNIDVLVYDGIGLKSICLVFGMCQVCSLIYFRKGDALTKAAQWKRITSAVCLSETTVLLQWENVKQDCIKFLSDRNTYN